MQPVGLLVSLAADMKKLLILIVVLAAGFIALWVQETSYVRTVKAEVLALEDVEGTRGLRRIHVRMPRGESMWVETYSPFFFRVGYPIKIAEYSHVLRGTTFEVVAN